HLQVEGRGAQREYPAAQHAGQEDGQQHDQQDAAESDRCLDDEVCGQAVYLDRGGVGERGAELDVQALQLRGDGGDALLPLGTERRGQRGAGGGGRGGDDVLHDAGLLLPGAARDQGAVLCGLCRRQQRHDLVVVDELLGAAELGQLCALGGGEGGAGDGGREQGVLARQDLDSPDRVDLRPHPEVEVGEPDVAQRVEQLQVGGDQAGVVVVHLLLCDAVRVDGEPVCVQLLQPGFDLGDPCQDVGWSGAGQGL